MIAQSVVYMTLGPFSEVYMMTSIWVNRESVLKICLDHVPKLAKMALFPPPSTYAIAVVLTVLVMHFLRSEFILNTNT